MPLRTQKLLKALQFEKHLCAIQGEVDNEPRKEEFAFHQPQRKVVIVNKRNGTKSTRTCFVIARVRSSFCKSIQPRNE
jgi:hypothetical protein